MKQIRLSELAGELSKAGLNVLPIYSTSKSPYSSNDGEFSYSWYEFQIDQFPAHKSTCPSKFYQIQKLMDYVKAESPNQLFDILGGIELINGWTKSTYAPVTFDFDHHGIAFDSFCELLKDSGFSDILKQSYIEGTMTEGNRHLIVMVKCDQTPIPTSEKLAIGDDGSVMIETRARGGLTKLYASNVIQGDLTHLPILTVKQFRKWVSLAKSLNMRKVNPPKPTFPQFKNIELMNQHSENISSGYKFGNDADFLRSIHYSDQLLKENGWKVVKVVRMQMRDGTTNNATLYRRPGTEKFCSGSLYDDEHGQTFHCFTTNFEPLLAGHSYTPIDLFTSLHLQKNCSTEINKADRKEMIKKGGQMVRKVLYKELNEYNEFKSGLELQFA